MIYAYSLVKMNISRIVTDISVNVLASIFVNRVDPACRAMFFAPHIRSSVATCGSATFFIVIIL